MDKRYILLFLGVIVLGIFVRTALISKGGFYEPDNFNYYAVIKQTLANPTFSITSKLSGVPPVAYNEYPGLIYITAVPSLLLKVNPYYVMEVWPLIMAVIGMIAIALLTYELWSNKWVALLSALLFGMLNGAIYHTSALQYRGEVFVPVLLVVLLLVIVKAGKTKSKKRMATLYAIAAVLFAFTLEMWGGASYILPIVFLTLLGSILSYWLSPKKAIFMVVAFAVVLCVAFPFIFPSTYQSLMGTASIQINEMQPPTLAFYLASFGWALLFAPIGIFIYFRNRLTRESVLSFSAVLSMFIITFFLQTFEIRWNILLVVPMAILGAVGFGWFYEYLKSKPITPSFFVVDVSVIVCGCFLIFLIGMGITAYTSFGESGITPGLLNATLWLNNNTAKNATVMALWPDGSVIEGWSNRESFSDSIQGGVEMPAFGQFLFAKDGNYSFLNITKPNYLLARKLWVSYAPWVAQEGGVSSNDINGTNLQAFENGTAKFPIVFHNNDTIIYRIAT